MLQEEHPAPRLHDPRSLLQRCKGLREDTQAEGVHNRVKGIVWVRQCCHIACVSMGQELAVSHVYSWKGHADHQGTLRAIGISFKQHISALQCWLQLADIQLGAPCWRSTVKLCCRPCTRLRACTGLHDVWNCRMVQ